MNIQTPISKLPTCMHVKLIATLTSSFSSSLTTRLLRLALVLTLSGTMTACGLKYSSGPGAATNTEAPAQLPDNLPDSTTTTSPIIRPTTQLPDNTPRSLPAALALRQQAGAAVAEENHIRAIGLLERAIRISPKDPQTFQALAQSHLAMNRPQQALELTKRALTLNPTAEQRRSLNELVQQCLSQL